jgi:small subunit ribosomal protein S5
VKDILTKSFGSNNPINLVKATLDGLSRLRSKETIAELRGVEL